MFTQYSRQTLGGCATSGFSLGFFSRFFVNIYESASRISAYCPIDILPEDVRPCNRQMNCQLHSFCAAPLIMRVFFFKRTILHLEIVNMCRWRKIISSLPSSSPGWVSWGDEIWEDDRRRWGRPSSPRTPRARPPSGHWSTSPSTLRRIGIANSARIFSDEVIYSCYVNEYRVFRQLVDLGWVDLDLGCSTILPSCSAITAEIPSA